MANKHKQKPSIPKRTAKEPDSPGVLEVSFTPGTFKNAVIQGCEMKLREVLKAPHLAFDSTNYNRGVIRFHLTGSPYSAAAGSRSYWVFPLRAITDPFWVGVHVDFEFGRTLLRLKAASIVLFKGERDGLRVPILRAEWDCPSLDARRRHAQPHWHVYQQSAPTDMVLPPSPEAEPRPVRSLDDYEPGESLFADSAPAVAADFEMEADLGATDIGGENVHLAMSARWHDDNGGHSVEFTKTSFARWIHGCLSYLLVQLKLA